MKTRLKPRMFPEAGECLHDDRGFEEQMADLGVEIIRRNPAGILISPLAAGVSKMLERIGERQVRLVITVKGV